MARLHNPHCQGNATVSSFFYWATCHGQQYTIFKDVQRNATMGFLYCNQAMYVAFSNTEWYVGFHVKCLILQSFKKFGFCWQILMKVSHIKLHENPSSGGWIVICRWWMEVTKLLAAFCNYLNMPTKINFFIASVPHA